MIAPSARLAKEWRRVSRAKPAQRLRSTGAGAAFSALLAGCGGADDPPPETTVVAAESIQATLIEGSLLVLAADGLLAPAGLPGPGGGGPRARVAEFVAGRVVQAFRPEGCATATSAAGTVDLTLRGCTGGSRLGSLDGAARLTYEVTRLLPLAITVTAQSDGLRVNGATVDLDVTVDAAAERPGGPWNLGVRTRTASTGRRNVRLVREGDYALTWDPSTRCATAEGQWRTTSAAGAFETRLAGFRSCMGRCPQAGGSVTITAAAPAPSITLTFTGSATALWGTTTGATGTIPIACEN